MLHAKTYPGMQGTNLQLLPPQYLKRGYRQQRTQRQKAACGQQTAGPGLSAWPVGAIALPSSGKAQNEAYQKL